MVILCGASGSGKSSFAAQHFPETYVVSSDRCRALVCDDMRSQTVNREAFELVNHIARLRMALGCTTIIDSTALQEFARQSLLHLAHYYSYPTLLLVFDVSEEVCAARDAARIDPPPVGREVVALQFELFRELLAKVTNEGFGTVIVLKSEQINQVRVQLEENHR